MMLSTVRPSRAGSEPFIAPVAGVGTRSPELGGEGTNELSSIHVASQARVAGPA